MRISNLALIGLFVIVATSTVALDKQAYLMREDYSTEPLSECALHYYYIPCLTYSWFWAYTGWDRYDIVGAWYEIGDL